MDFRQLQVLVTIIRSGSFSQAARELYVTQPTISSQVQALEGELGVSLFERKQRKTTLTQAGREFYPYALDILNSQAQGITKVKALATAGPLLLSASSTPGIYILPYLLQRIPDYRYTVQVSHTSDVLQAVLQYHVELGFVGEISAHKDLAIAEVYQDEMVIITANCEPYVNWPQEISWGDLLSCRFVLRGEGSATRLAFARAVSDMGEDFHHLEIGVEIDSMEGAKNMVAQGFGISVVPSIALHATDDFLIFRLKETKIKRSFSLIYRNNRVLSPQASGFIKSLKEFIDGKNTGLPR